MSKRTEIPKAPLHRLFLLTISAFQVARSYSPFSLRREKNNPIVGTLRAHVNDNRPRSRYSTGLSGSAGTKCFHLGKLPPNTLTFAISSLQECACGERICVGITIMFHRLRYEQTQIAGISDERVKQFATPAHSPTGQQTTGTAGCTRVAPSASGSLRMV